MSSKIKNLWNNKYIKSFILLFVVMVLVELIFFLVGKLSIGLYNSIRIILGTSIISLVLTLILSFIKEKIRNIIICVYSFAVSIYAMLQLGFKSFIGVYMSVNTSSQLNSVKAYIKDFFDSFKWTYYLVLIPFILLLVYLIFFDKKIGKEKFKKTKFKSKKKIEEEKQIQKKKTIKNVSIVGIIIVVLCGAYVATLNLKFMQNKIQMVSNKDLFKYPSNPSISINQFGVISYGILDIKTIIFPVNEEQKLIAYEAQQKEKTKNSRIIDDTAWKKVIEEETNDEYRNLHNYFISRDITDKNKYTGMFKDKNLIVIMMESVNDIIINEKDFPNFYKLYSQGWHWENNYSPRNSCSTGNNEMSGMIGLYSIYNTCTANIYKNNTYFESMFNLFNNANYQTTSMHNYTEAYYYRKTIHPNMGSGKYYGVQDLGIEYSNVYRNWSSDEDFMNQVLNILGEYGKKEKYMTWLTTVSSHQPYKVSSIQGDQYLSEFTDNNYPEDLQRYLSKLKILDNALGILIDGLEKQGTLDDTVIVLYGDHYPYGLKHEVINQALDYDVSVDYEAERVPFVIYNSEMEPKTFKEYTSYINILPTIANLFDLDYDPRLYVGTDLLSKDYQSLVVFADGSWQNEIALYDASNSEVKYYTKKKYNDEEIMKITNDVSMKVQMSSSAIKNNYFEYLKTKTDEQKQIAEQEQKEQKEKEKVAKANTKKSKEDLS